MDTNADKNTFSYFKGHLPILVSMPHNGHLVPEDIKRDMHDYACESMDTDWFMDKVYGFTREMGCHIVQPHYSRYVIDLNRSSEDISLYPGENVTELCPTSQFDFKPIYRDGLNPTAFEIKRRVTDYWMPYHRQLQLCLELLKKEHGFALLFEAHSIKSSVPRFFSGQLPDLNFGTNSGASCSETISELINDWQPMGYSKVVNGRFKGGFITRNYGSPTNGIDAVQLELSQATYLNESNRTIDPKKLETLKVQLKKLFDELLEAY